jgi:phytoene synthase
MPGEVRLQWWRDALESGDAGGNPVAGALLETIARFGLPLAPFTSLLEARTFDLYNDPMPDRTAFEGYAGDTTSVLFQIAAIVLAGRDVGSADAAGHAGIAHALTALLRSFPFHLSRKQLFLPADVFAAHGVAPGTIYARENAASVGAALADLRNLARVHLQRSRDAMKRLPSLVAPVFLPLALLEPYLRRMERPEYHLFGPPVELPQWQRQWILWRASKWGF